MKCAQLKSGSRKLISLTGMMLFVVLMQAVTGCGQRKKSNTSNNTDTASHHDMVRLDGGTYEMGSDDPGFPDASPIHRVTVKAFWMDKHEVTNAQFAAFVEATHYITVAERKLNPADFPNVDPDKLVPGSAVFTPIKPDGLDNPLQWWKYEPGASWRHPYGAQSTLKGIENYPAVHICYEDANHILPFTGAANYIPMVK